METPKGEPEPTRSLEEFERQEEEFLRASESYGPEEIEAFRRMTPEQRLAIALQLSQARRDRWHDAMRAVYPDADEQEVRLLVAERFYGRDVIAPVRARLGRERVDP